jgi:hypothetical protein
VLFSLGPKVLWPLAYVSVGAMKIALIHAAQLPVHAYGGTERIVWWLSKALAARGVEVTLACLAPSTCEWAKVVHIDFDKPITDQLPDADLLHYFNTPAEEPIRPYLVTIEGNGKPGETFYRNTAFVSRNHARRHAAQCFVYNGVDPDDYIFSDKKDGSLLFLAKASWRVKNVEGAIRLAKRTGKPLHIVGGSKRFFNHRGGIHWEGMLGGKPKAEIISRASGLLFPVLWNEPFGIAVIEALVSGTPVLASGLGSLPELLVPEVGRICEDDDSYVEAIGQLDQFKPSDCRDWAMTRFSHHVMADKYLSLYEKVLAGESLNPSLPFTLEAVDALYSIPLQAGAGSNAALPA